MDLHATAGQAGIAKRIRQACASCRRKKTKCSGERPICFHCRRSNQRCVYEPYSNTVGETVPSAAPVAPYSDNAAILERITTLESRLAELSGRSPSQPGVFFSNTGGIGQAFPATQNTGAAPLRFSPYPSRFNGENLSLPPPPVLRSVIDTFFVHVHNQPYSYVQENSFRQKLDMDILPRCLLLAVLASAVRFSEHEYYEGKKQEATETYSRESWMSVLAEYLTAEHNLNIEVVQTVNLLAIADYTAGRVSSAWLKIGLAARVSQDLRLMVEPDSSLPFSEQEERRRVFWSGYLLDRLISCGRSRPLAFHDEDCNVRLPCDEETFLAGEWKDTQTLQGLLSWDTKVNENPCPFALVILMASIFGSCTRYVHRELAPDKVPPWDTRSEYSTINSSLLLLESYSKIGSLPITEVIRGGDATHQSQAGHLIFAHTLFHLCHCLLSHPFLVRLRLKQFGSKAPISFAARVLQVGRDHAKQLLDIVHEATAAGYLVESSFYPYCIVIAGGIQSLASCLNQPETGNAQNSDPLLYFHRSLEVLGRLGQIWTHAANMELRLREFHARAPEFASLLDPGCLTEDLTPAMEETFWSMIDYGVVGTSPGKSPISHEVPIPNIPSPASWTMGSDVFASTSLGFDGSGGGLFSGMTPSPQLHDVDNLLTHCP